jgi:predicted ATPase
MWIKSVQIKNIKSFEDSGVIRFLPRINLLVGPNNAGKSIIIRAISLLQPLPNHPDASAFLGGNTRHGTQTSEVTLELVNPNKQQLKIPVNWDINNWQPKIRLIKSPPNTQPPYQFLISQPNGNEGGIGMPICNQTQPDNFLYTYLSRRKPASLHATINLANARTIEEALQHLPSKVDQISSSRNSTAFNEVCQKTLGFTVTCIHSPEGKQLGLVLGDDTIIPVTSMGEGTINILVFLVHLVTASGKLFLIEEIENDLHPTALKHLLDFIVSKSESNQFIISTHSNIVARYLGTATLSQLFSIQMKLADETRIPTSVCQPVAEDPESRIQLLESLGYEPHDFYLWKGYLILEESTAERLIRDFFIPFLIPILQGKLKTISAGGIGNVEVFFSDFHRIFVFIHTAPQYKERAWVGVDGGVEGKKLVEELKTKFKSWSPEHFRSFTAENFEKYYPQEFQEKATNILALSHGPKKQEEKGKLAEEVLRWALADPIKAHAEFKICAKEILDFLNEISTKL